MTQEATTSKIVPREVRAARLATYGVLFVNGLATTSWIVHLPDLVAQTGVTDAQLGFVISSIGVGSVIFIAVMGWVLSRFGTRIAAAIALGLFGLAFPTIGLSTNWQIFALSLFVGGAGSAMVEISGSTSGSRLEHAYGKPMMPAFIGSMAVGMVLGSLVGALSLKLGISTFAHLAGIGVVIWLMGVYAVPRLLSAEQDGTVGPKVRHFPKFNWRLVAISVIILISVIEGSALAFSTLYMSRDLGTTAAFAAFSVTAYTIGTAIAQLSGDWLRKRWSPAFLVRVSVIAGSVVLIAAMMVANPWFALFGFFAIGGGIAFVYPAGISASADTQPTPAPGVAYAQTIRYIGSFGAAPLVGFMSATYGLTSTFTMAALFGVVATLVFGGALGHQKGLGVREGGDLPEVKVDPPVPVPAADVLAPRGVHD